MLRFGLLAGRMGMVVLLAAAATTAAAQSPPGGGMAPDGGRTGAAAAAPDAGFPKPAGSGPLELMPAGSGPALLPEGTATPFAPPTLAPVEPALPTSAGTASSGTLSLSARLTADGPPIGTGVVWRIFAEEQAADGSRALVAERHGGSADFTLRPGGYFVYCGFGNAGTTQHVSVTAGGIKASSVILNAGGLRLHAVTGKDRPPLESADLGFDIYSLEVDSHGEPKPVALDVDPGTIVRLPAQTYNVVARYGNANARTTADIEVKAGKLSDITLTEKASRVTLKLVSTAGGEAIADTRWSILTQAGDLVTSGVGAFPSFVLAEGDYTVIANHEDGQFQRLVTVVAGEDTDIEVLAQGGSKLPD